MFEKYLQEIGLGEKEAQVYIALLSVDNDSVVDLSKKTKINRTTIYPTLESLAKKGLISEIKVDKKVRFQAEPPERLRTFVERQKTILEEQSERLNDVIPQLKSIHREAGEKPIVTYFEGKEGIISSVEQFFEYGKDEDYMHIIYSKDLIDDLFTEKEEKKFLSLRQDRKIKVKSVYNNKKGDLPQREGVSRTLIDDDKYPIKTDISVIGDLVKISILENNPSGILVKSKDFSETLRSIIEYINDHK